MSWWDRLLRWLALSGGTDAVPRVLTASMQAELVALAEVLERAPHDSLGDVLLSDAVVREMVARLRGIAGG